MRLYGRGLVAAMVMEAAGPISFDQRCERKSQHGLSSRKKVSPAVNKK